MIDMRQEWSATPIAPPARAGETPARDWFYRLHHFEEYPELFGPVRDWAARRLAVTPSPDVPAALALPDDPGDLACWADRAASWRAAHGDDVGVACRATQPRALLRSLAPSLTVDGGWLQSVSRPLDGHTAGSSALLACYLQRVGEGGHHGALYLDLLRGIGTPLPSPGAWGFARHPELAEAPFEAATLQLALGHFPGRFHATIVGCTLFAAALALHPAVAALGPWIRAQGGELRYLDRVGDPGFAAASRRAAIAAAAASLADSGSDVHWSAIQRGFATAYALHVAELAATVALADDRQSGARARMARLIRRKAPFARGYHGAKRLAGDPLDVWFAAAEQDVEAFLDALAASPYVRRGDPERSSLLATAVAPRGLMAGIFDADEVAVIRAWIVSLDGQPPVAVAVPAATTAPPPPPPPGPRSAEADRRFANLPPRDLYWHLLHIEDFPELRPFAKSFAGLWLARAGAGLDKGARAIPFATYEPAALEAWLLRQHAEQVASYAPDPTATPPSRAAVIEDSVQLCPMVLVDGAWLQRTGEVAFCATPVGRLLYRIHLDEVGGGDVRENHPNVYRELMADMGVALPPFGSRAFADWPGFRDAAFAVPNFWLAISLFPRHFLPELLGLNLAMELSGVGGTYRASRDALRHHGFSSAFVDLHNTVDNASTGHSAMALEAITLHLHDALENGGRDDVQRRWRRVWTGYRALTPPPGMV